MVRQGCGITSSWAKFIFWSAPESDQSASANYWKSSSFKPADIFSIGRKTLLKSETRRSIRASRFLCHSVLHVEYEVSKPVKQSHMRAEHSRVSAPTLAFRNFPSIPDYINVRASLEKNPDGSRCHLS